jgi:hypothetical protein
LLLTVGRRGALPRASLAALGPARWHQRPIYSDD